MLSVFPWVGPGTNLPDEATNSHVLSSLASAPGRIGASNCITRFGCYIGLESRPMSVSYMVTVKEYLSTGYRPDCDYVDSAVLERNLGEYDHGRLQGAIFAHYWSRRKEWGLQPVPGQRVQVAPTRFRVTDVCVVAGEPDGQIFRKPPFTCVEVLSKDDRIAEMQERVEDGLGFGVPYFWILDPRKRTAYQSTPRGIREVHQLVTENPTTGVPVEALFEE